VAAPDFQQVLELREVGIDGVEQPEVGDVGGAEIGEAQILLPALIGEQRAFRAENFDQPAGQGEQVFGATDVERRGNEFLIDLQRAGGIAANAGEADGGVTIQRLIAGQDAKVLARDLDGLLVHPAIFVAQHGDFREVAGAGILARGQRNIQAGDALLRDAQEHVELVLVDVERFRQGLGRGRRIGRGNVERHAVREKASRRCDGHVPGRQLFMVNPYMAEAPRTKTERFGMEAEGTFNKTILGLQVLGTEERPLHPDHRLQLPHSDSKGNTRRHPV
jgi:hypothetical protein